MVKKENPDIEVLEMANPCTGYRKRLYELFDLQSSIPRRAQEDMLGMTRWRQHQLSVTLRKLHSLIGFKPCLKH